MDLDSSCWMAQFAGAIAAAVFRQVVAGGNYPISKPGGDWRAFVMEIVLATILVSVILHTATGHRRIGHKAAIAVGSTGLPVEKETEAAEGDALPI